MNYTVAFGFTESLNGDFATEGVKEFTSLDAAYLYFRKLSDRAYERTDLCVAVALDAAGETAPGATFTLELAETRTRFGVSDSEYAENLRLADIMRIEREMLAEVEEFEG